MELRERSVGVVLVHGVRTSGSMWRAQVAELETHGFPTIAVDLPGHGRRREETFTLRSAAGVIEAAVQEHRDAGRRVAVVGLSLGGYLSLRWAADAPVPPDALVLTSCTALPGGLAHRGFLALSRLLAATGDGALLVSEGAARLAVGRAAAADVSAGGVSVPGQLGALRAMLACEPVGDLRAVVDRGVPVTFVQGEWDHFRLDERAFRAVAGPRWVVVRRAHHLVSLHRPGAYGRAVRDALAVIVRDGDRPGAAS